MNVLAFIAIWVMFSVAVGIAVGYSLGRGAHRKQKERDTGAEREAALDALVGLLKSTEQLTNDVDSHNIKMKQVSRDVGGLQVSGEMEIVQRSLLSQITEVIKSNQRLEDDLVVARSRMEEQAEEIDRTRREARTDVLSGVANRKAFDERLLVLLSWWRREQMPFTLVLADIDHFKRINDTHGHQAGDQIVAHVGQFLRQAARDGDYVARYGGDEFALLLPNTELEAGAKLVEQIREKTARSNFDIGLRGEGAVVTFSIGVTSSYPGDVAETMIQRADQGLYAAKRGGRNQMQAVRPDNAPAALTAAPLSVLESSPSACSSAIPC